VIEDQYDLMAILHGWHTICEFQKEDDDDHRNDEEEEDEDNLLVNEAVRRQIAKAAHSPGCVRGRGEGQSSPVLQMGRQEAAPYFLWQMSRLPMAFPDTINAVS
jgi:hypothetical protein